MNPVDVSLVSTVKNEERSIDTFLDSLFQQSRRPDEVIVVDGGSADATVARIRMRADADPAIHLIEAPGANIAEGRNIAIEQALGRVIAVADAGTVLHSRWLERIVQPLLADDGVAVASGFFEPDGADWLERAISVVITPHVSEVDSKHFLPSSRSVAFMRDWWERVGGYPEWLQHCEDLVFDFALRDAGAIFTFVPDARVTWRARRSLSGFFLQYFAYARGDGHAHLWTHRHAIRYAAYATGASLAIAAMRFPLAGLALGTGMALHFRRAFRRVTKATCFVSERERAAAYAVAPVVVVLGDVAKMIGYPVGLVERARVVAPRHLSESLGHRG